MNKFKNFLNSLTLFEIMWLVISSILLFAIELYFEDTIIGIICTITGMLNVVLVAKGSITNYFFGIISVTLYTYISYNAGYGGDFVTFAFYYIPLQFIGLYYWLRKSGDSLEYTSAKSMNAMQLLLSLCILIVGTLITMFLLPIITDIFNMPINELPLVDAFTTFVGIYAGILMVKGYKEQWYLWIAVNVGSIIMWINLLGSDPSAAAMIVMWGAYLFNAIYGAYNWNKLSKQ